MRQTNTLQSGPSPAPVSRPGEMSRYRIAGRAPLWAFLLVPGLLFAGCAAVTAAWCRAMADMGEMAMPGGWAMSMTWMRMPGQTWLAAAAGFLGMWLVMMVAMMLPSLLPTLWRYRQALPAASEAHRGWLTAWLGMGYFAVWAAAGMATFPLGVALAALAMQQPALARAVPMLAGGVVLSAGALQFTGWKARHLAGCRTAPEHARLPASDARAAWCHGLQLGRHCCCSCANLTAILLVIGVMDLGAMAAVTAAITAERLAPRGERVARAVGVLCVGVGLHMVVQAGLG